MELFCSIAFNGRKVEGKRLGSNDHSDVEGCVVVSVRAYWEPAFM